MNKNTIPEIEYLVRVLDNGVLIPDLIERNRAHLEGILHPSEHVWIYNEHGQILLQKRAENKSMPGKLDVSVAGHTSTKLDTHALESEILTYVQSWGFRRKNALREVEEELIGSLQFKEEDLQSVWIYRTFDLVKNNEHIVQYVLKISNDFTQIQFDPKEVAALQSVHFFDLESDLMKSTDYEFDLVTRDPHYYLPIFRAIRARLGLPKNEAFEDFVSRTPTEKPDFEPIILPISSTNSSETNS